MKRILGLAVLAAFVVAGCSQDSSTPAEPDNNTAAIGEGVSPNVASGPGGTYEVTIYNLSTGQPLSPPVAATHKSDARVFRLGQLASDELESIAEDGNEAPMAALLGGAPSVTDVVDVGMPLTRFGDATGGFADHITFTIEAAAGDRLSLAMMLICTNDGFTGLDSVRLPGWGARAFWLTAYDAGTEDNTEASSDIVDACSALGPGPLAGDPNGNEDDAVNTDPPRPIRAHSGIMGGGDLDPALHGWHGQIGLVVVRRVTD